MASGDEIWSLARDCQTRALQTGGGGEKKISAGRSGKVAERGNVIVRDSAEFEVTSPMYNAVYRVAQLSRATGASRSFEAR